MEISIFSNIYQNSDGEKTSIDAFINRVKFGHWKHEIEKIRSAENKQKRNELKKLLPYITPSGLFKKRNADGLIQHSGFICIDIDDVDDVQKTIDTLKNDPFTYAVFRSTSGNGCAVFVRIDPKRHADAFAGIEKYYVDKYNILIDPACKDITRARFVSYDENIFVNPESKTFIQYVQKSQKINPKKIPNVITGQKDIDNIIEQIKSSGVDITGSEYSRFLEIGFSIASEFGENGRDLFHVVCSNSPKYSPSVCDRQFNHCLKSKGHGITIGTFFYYCKENNVQIITNETREIVSVSLMAKKGGRGVENTLNLLKELNNIDPDDSREIVEKVFNQQNDDKLSTLPKLELIELFLVSNYRLKRNEITRFIENNGIEIDTNFINSIYIRARKEVDDKIKFDEIDRIINSDFIENYNPLKDWFIKNENTVISNDWIQLLSESINSKNPYKHDFIKKWLVGIVASVFDRHSPLLLVLCGEQNTGKTEFFRRLLPDELRVYYAENKLDAEKDSEILMTQKILIVDDEFGGKSKIETKRLKELTSKQYFTLREPYGRKNVTLRRLSVLAGTSNETRILNDPTGNRRIIPIEVNSIDFEMYNSVDKNELFIQIYKLYLQGFEYNLTKGEILTLNNQTDDFEQISIERELILKYYKPESQKQQFDNVVFLQTSEIKAFLEKSSGQKLNLFRITNEMKILGYEMKPKKINGSTRRVYSLIIVNQDVENEVDEFPYQL